MPRYKAILSEQLFFKGLDPDALQLIAHCAAETCFDAGDFIYHQGEAADRFYLIRSGKVALEVFTPERGMITIQTVGEGDILGSSWLFPPYVWHYEAQALEFTRTMVFGAECLRAASEEYPQLGYELVKRFAHVLMQRLQAARMQLLDLYANPLRGL